MTGNTVNKIILKNVKIVSITSKRNGTGNITVEVPMNGASNKKRVFLKVTCRKGTDLNGINVTDYIDVNGYVRAYSLRPANEDEEWKKYQYIVAESITKSQTLLEKDYGITGKYYGPSEAICLLSGRIVNVSENNGWQKATIIVDYDNPDRKASFVRINYKIRRDVRLVKSDIISALCSLYSDRKNIRGVLMDFEDIVIRDFSVIGHYEPEKAEEKVTEAETETNPEVEEFVNA